MFHDSWGASWLGNWGTSWGYDAGGVPVEVDDEYRYYYDRKKHLAHARKIAKQDRLRHDDDNLLLLCLI